MKDKINIFTISDIHLGHLRNKTSDIIKHLELYITDNIELIKELDLFIIAGDLFDKLLTTKSIEYSMILRFMSKVFILCKTYNIKLRVLEGTPSHDYKQLKPFVEVITEVTKGVDFKYIDYLDIEWIEDLGINVLYIPDEWKHNAKDTFKEVQEKLKEKNIEEVDIAIMHGCFKYQIPLLKDMNFTHEEIDYLNIVKYYIFIGHIHTHSTYERILAPGSFDRLVHGEEELKGGIFATIYNTGEMDYKFICNPYATPFITLNYNDVDLEVETLVNKILKDLKTYNISVNDFHLRILLKDNTYINILTEMIKKKIPDVTLTFKTNKFKELQENIEKQELNVIEINPNNIYNLVSEKIDLLEISNEKKKSIKMLFKTYVS